MKIAMVTDSFYPTVGGSETAIRMLSETLIEMGHQVKIYGVFKEVQNPNHSKLDVVAVSSKIFGFDMKLFGFLYNLNNEIKNFKPDVVNAHFLLKSGYLGVKVAKKNNIASVVTVRGKGIFYKANSLKLKLMFYIFRRTSLTADRMMATSAEMADIVQERWGRHPYPVSNGVDTNHFRPGINSKIKERLGLSDKKIILCVRRLVPKNGIEYMVRAMPEILKVVPNAHLVLVAPKIREYENLTEICNQLNIGGSVSFVGSVDHQVLPEYLNMSDVVVQPSIAEARSLACLEALASGAALIVTNTGGLAELIVDKVNGVLIPAFEESTYQVGEIKSEGVKNLESAVITVLSDDKLRETIKKGARESSLQYSWPEIVRQVVGVYKEAIEINSKNVQV